MVSAEDKLAKWERFSTPELVLWYVCLALRLWPVASAHMHVLTQCCGRIASNVLHLYIRMSICTLELLVSSGLSTKQNTKKKKK